MHEAALSLTHSWTGHRVRTAVRARGLGNRSGPEDNRSGKNGYDFRRSSVPTGKMSRFNSPGSSFHIPLP